MRDIIINLQISDTWSIQLTIAIIFISSKDNDNECIMLSKSDNIEFVIGLLESLLSRYQIDLDTSMRGSDFVFDSVQLCIINVTS